MYSGACVDADHRKPDQAVNGYMHWSSYLYTSSGGTGGKEVYYNDDGWEAFQCPDIEGADFRHNTFAGKSQGMRGQRQGGQWWLI